MKSILSGLAAVLFAWHCAVFAADAYPNKPIRWVIDFPPAGVSDIMTRTIGTRLSECLKAAEELASYGLSATVADARFVKPIDTDLVRRLADGHEVLVTVEEGSTGGFGALVLHHLAATGLLDRGLKVRTMTLPDVFIDHD